MAKYSKKNLEKLLDFLNNEILHEPSNAWFVNELYKLLPNNLVSPSENKDIKNIERYLGLDYKLDSRYSPCDYSFLDDFLQEKAESDYREMRRFQLGLRGHKKDFAEFCRYAILQAELILNFFYDEYYIDKGGISEAIDDIKFYSKYKNPNNDILYIENIPFNNKLWAFGKQYHYDTSLLDNARKLRNSISHRSSKADEANIILLHQKLISYGIKIKEDGSLPYIEQHLLKHDDVKQYKFELFLKQMPFNGVELALKELVDTVFDLLKSND